MIPVTEDGKAILDFSVYDVRVLRIQPTDSPSNKEKIFDKLFINARRMSNSVLLAKAFERVNKQELIQLLFSREYHFYTTSKKYKLYG